MKVMVVDDERDIEPLFRQRFRKELRAGELQFEFSFSAEEALQRMNEPGGAEIVLILSDINMPGMNGLELLRQLKEKFSALKIFIVTAYDDATKYQTALKYGADGYLTKPIDFERLKQQLLSGQSTSGRYGT
jgi:CheY-like chemotaxis protein